MKPPVCLVTQPIHQAAIDVLRANGVTVRQASQGSMACVMAEAEGVDAVITRDLGFSEQAMIAAPNLQIIAGHGSGTDSIDLAAAARRGILVTHTPGMNSRSVAELTIGLMIGAARRICAADRAVHRNDWAYRYKADGIELHGRILGLVGFGTIARMVAGIASAGLGMRVIAWSPSVPAECFAECGVDQSPTLDDLLGRSDVVSLHRRLQPGAPPLLTEAHIARLRPGAIVVNTGRGAAIDQAAMAEALRGGRIGAAALDVLAQEPPSPMDPILAAPHATITPHLGATTEESLRRMALLCAAQVMDALDGRVPEFLVVSK
jgi:D-3-phosphoglycerate dehydrogenase / 2-oxoglutarate reductase